ncbi:MAG: glycosyltransferase [Nitrospira sp. CR1.3]|nr:glycosyltransferase [Nitrospira sp. CR1.3]
MRLAIVTNILTPYKVDLFKAMAERIEDFDVLVMAKREENRLWEIGHTPFKCQVLPGLHLKGPGVEASFHVNYGIWRRLRRINPDIVMCGGFAPAHLSAFLFTRAGKKHYVQWGEFALSDGAESSPLRRMLRRLLIGRAAGCIASSTKAREAFVHYGADPQSVLTALLPFDVTGLHKRVTAYRASQAGDTARRQYPGPVLLWVGQLIDRKGVRELLSLYSRVRAKMPAVHLLIAGEGPLREWCQSEVRLRGWDRVRLLGNIPPDQLFRIYALADVFVLTTRYDCFGLVLGEAMACELPVVASIHAAATLDLVEERRTGFRCDPHRSEEASAKILEVLALSSRDRAAIGRAAYEIVKQCDASFSAGSMVRFLSSLNKSPHDASLLRQQIGPSLESFQESSRNSRAMDV